MDVQTKISVERVRGLNVTQPSTADDGKAMPWHQWPMARLGARVLIAMREAENVELSFAVRQDILQARDWRKAEAITPVLMSWTCNERSRFSANCELWEELPGGHACMSSDVADFLYLAWWLSRGLPLGEAPNIGKFRLTLMPLGRDAYAQLKEDGLPSLNVLGDRVTLVDDLPTRMKLVDYMAALHECREWLDCDE